MQSDFEPMPDVVAQQRVDVEVARGPVHLSTVGTAMTDARIGDLVPVRAEPAQTLVRGRVIARNKVRVDE
jgi:flagella basal body P-ring formation protein FlgA